MLRSPSPVAALLLGASLVIFVTVLPPMPALTLLAGGIATLSLNAGFRMRVPIMLKALLPFALLMSLVALGRIIGGGGADVRLTVDEYLVRFPFVGAVLTTATLLAVCIRPWDALAIADLCRLPRTLTYVLVSLYPLSSHIRELGQRQLVLLDLKGVDRRSFTGRIFAYRRLISPLFSSVLTQQVIHARSLSLRGFFRSKADGYLPPLVGSDIIWGLLLLLVLILSLLSPF